MPAPPPAVRSARPITTRSVPVPPARLALLRGGRPLKAWRYVGIYGPDLMLCAGRVRIGGVPQSFWAVWDRHGAVLRERTTGAPAGGVRLPDGAVHVRSRAVHVDLRLEPAGDPVHVLSPHGRQAIWTRKLPVRARGTVRLGRGAAAIAVDAPGLVDDSAGHHARVTAWEWSAGAGTLPDGRSVTWNLVAGVHDGPAASERTVWIDGAAHEVGPVRFTPELDAVAFAEGGTLRFAAEAVRERRDRVGPIHSDYVQPFGAFSGVLPGAGPLATGHGVMERHRARW